MPARTRSTASVVISLDWRAAAARASAFSSWRRTDDDHVPWATFFFCVFASFLGAASAGGASAFPEAVVVGALAFSDVALGGAGGLTAGVAATVAAGRPRPVDRAPRRPPWLRIGGVGGGEGR